MPELIVDTVVNPDKWAEALELLDRAANLLDVSYQDENALLTDIDDFFESLA